MTRSIFDPDGGETERSGSTHSGPAPGSNSHMPPDAVDGRVDEDEIDDVADATNQTGEEDPGNTEEGAHSQEAVDEIADAQAESDE